MSQLTVFPYSSPPYITKTVLTCFCSNFLYSRVSLVPALRSNIPCFEKTFLSKVSLPGMISVMLTSILSPPCPDKPGIICPAMPERKFNIFFLVALLQFGHYFRRIAKVRVFLGCNTKRCLQKDN